MFFEILRKVTTAYGHERLRDASCNITLEVLRKDARMSYQPADHKPTADELLNLCHEFSTILTSCMREKEVVVLTGRAWKIYLDDYGVSALEPDLYKLAYWYGEALVHLLRSKKDLSTNVVCAAKIHRLIVMDWFLHKQVGNELTNHIFTKLCMTACRDLEVENLGKYGMYWIFKSISLQLDDKKAA